MCSTTPWATPWANSSYMYCLVFEREKFPWVIKLDCWTSVDVVALFWRVLFFNDWSRYQRYQRYNKPSSFLTIQWGANMNSCSTTPWATPWANSSYMYCLVFEREKFPWVIKLDCWTSVDVVALFWRVLFFNDWSRYQRYQRYNKPSSFLTIQWTMNSFWRSEILCIWLVFSSCVQRFRPILLNPVSPNPVSPNPVSPNPVSRAGLKYFGALGLDTIVGPHTHPTLPSSSDPINLTGVWGITTEKVWNCKCHRRVSEAQPGQNFGGGKLRTEPEPMARSAWELRAKPEPR